MAGYHIRDIKKGQFGEISKIIEEVDELCDASEQKCKIMELIEISDLYGAIQGYLEKYHPSTTMEDISAMSSITQRAFRSGARK